jgi:hypothetical protein
VFSFVAATLSYAKAFRVNSRVVNAIEKYEGYNIVASKEIENALSSYGYTVNKNYACPDRNDGGKLIERFENNYAYCIYYYKEDARHYTYGVLTYIYVDLPFVSDFLRLPVYTRTERIFKFNSGEAF